MQSIKLNVTKIQKLLSSHREVFFGYLFGSYAKNDIRPLSDIDIAVYVNEELPKDRRFDLRLRLIYELCHLLQTDNIDLVILNDANIYLAYEVVRYGEIIYCNDELRRIRFEARALSLYFDRKYYYDRHSKFVIEHIAKEGIL